jgi:hypothetical protein
LGNLQLQRMHVSEKMKAPEGAQAFIKAVEVVEGARQARGQLSQALPTRRRQPAALQAYTFLVFT